MNVTVYPKAYQSAFREASFVLSGVAASSGTDIGISSYSYAETLGVKRVYATGEVSVNAAPYVRRFLGPEPLCGAKPMDVVTGEGRTVACRVSAGDYTSSAVWLTAGSDDAPVNMIISAAPSVVKIRPGESDEISVIADGTRMRPLISFMHEGTEYTDYSIPNYSGVEMLTLVVNPDAVGRLFTEHTGADVSEMTGFTVWIRMTENWVDTFCSRRYEIDRNGTGGRRIAWVNRYGAVDYYTFPYVTGGSVSGSRGRIYTPDGYRTVATSAETTETLLSEPCDPESVRWLSEIFSSPAVWTIDGTDYRKVEVADGASDYSSSRPGTVSVIVGPVKKPVSRKY